MIGLVTVADDTAAIQAMLAGGEDPKTNAVPKVTGVWPSKGIVIGWQGSSLMGPFALELGLRDWYDMPKKGADEIVIRQKGEVVILAANSPQGTCYCVGELLYRNGARFLHNGGTDGGDGTFLEFMTGLKAPRDWRYSPDVRIRDGFRDRCARSKRTGAALDAELVDRPSDRRRTGRRGARDRSVRRPQVLKGALVACRRGIIR